uniref:MATH domain-containing protein n=1 Tax=Syphacia muris TaxID=451379 RepID=A0A0N5A868_9BILA
MIDDGAAKALEHKQQPKDAFIIKRFGWNFALPADERPLIGYKLMMQYNIRSPDFAFSSFYLSLELENLKLLCGQIRDCKEIGKTPKSKSVNPEFSITGQTIAASYSVADTRCLSASTIHCKVRKSFKSDLTEIIAYS